MTKTSRNLSTAGDLRNTLKSARRIMRKDKGISGDLDRLPMLTWLLFLKFLDDHDRLREDEAKLSGKSFRGVIDSPYRWRDWAAKEDGITGDRLLAFVNSEETDLPDGGYGPGLFAYLRSLEGNGDDGRRDVVATVFKGISNRMASGYLLRDVINRVGHIHFDSSEEVHTLSLLYEAMLKEMRDASEDGGEFYTPRPLVRVIVDVVHPVLGETILDPACGTGGFLVEAHKTIAKQCNTVQEWKMLRDRTLFGIEPKPLPYLLVQMNLLLHGIDRPIISNDNALATPLRELGDSSRVDIIMTNPPFGGEEEKGILGNFPPDKQTSETALLFLQLIMRRLRRKPGPGRAAVIVPDGVLAAKGVGARVKQELLENFNLHTVLRLPEGVFSPYTSIPTNVLFFDRSSPTSEIWFFEHPLPAELKRYTKTKPLRYEEFELFKGAIKKRATSENSWIVTVDQVKEGNYNLDVKNPLRKGESLDRPLSQILSLLQEDAARVGVSLEDVLAIGQWEKLLVMSAKTWKKHRISSLLQLTKRLEELSPDTLYGLLGVQLSGKGPFLRERKMGSEIGASRLSRVEAGEFIYSRLFAWKGAFGIVPQEFDGCYVSGEFPTFAINQDVVLPQFLRLYFSRSSVWAEVEKLCQGTTKGSRNRFKKVRFLAMEISVPDLASQRTIVELARQTAIAGAKTLTVAEAVRNLPLQALAHLYDGQL